MTAQITPFGQTRDGQEVAAVTIDSGALRVTLLTWGAVLQDVRLAGVDHPLTLGAPDIAAYQGRMNSFGALMGPVANRIKGAAAPIAGVRHAFEANLDGAHTKHGGSHGPQHRVWHLLESSPTHALLETVLAAGQSGFPGTRTLRAEYRVEGTHLDMVVIGTTDAPSLMNIANHSYWNLDGSDAISGHILQIAAERYTASGADLMVTGELAEVVGTRLDFRAARAFEPGPENRFDLNYVLAEARRPLAPACTLTGTSGVRMEMFTTEPGLQVFDLGSFSTDPHPGHGGTPYPRFSAVALEAQVWPDAANHAGFPSIEIGPDHPYHQHTRWRFSAP